MSRKTVVRFVVVDPVTGRHSGVWRVWTHNRDVYIAASDLGGILKVSLHPGAYRIAYTDEHWATGDLPNNAPGPGRQIMSYQPSKIIDGVEYAWRLAFQPNALLNCGLLSNDVADIIAPGSEHIVQVDIWICEAGVTKQPRRPIDPSPLHLADGRHVWVGYETYRAKSGTAHDVTRRDFPTAIVEFADRLTVDDAPGLVLRPAEIT
jgi:hypothetical protein